MKSGATRLLADTVSTGDGLDILVRVEILVVPVRIDGDESASALNEEKRAKVNEHDDGVGCRQVDADSTSASREQVAEVLGSRGVEVVDTCRTKRSSELGERSKAA